MGSYVQRSLDIRHWHFVRKASRRFMSVASWLLPKFRFAGILAFLGRAGQSRTRAWYFRIILCEESYETLKIRRRNVTTDNSVPAARKIAIYFVAGTLFRIPDFLDVLFCHTAGNSQTRPSQLLLTTLKERSQVK